MRTASKFAHQVRAAREAKGWTQQELAHHAGISIRYASSIENGQNITLEVLVKTAHALGLGHIQLEGVEINVGEPYRQHIANLEAIDEKDREMVLLLVEKYAAAVGKPVPQPKPRKTVTTEPETTEPSDGKRPTDERKRPIGMR